jgi:hypothetical protein
LLEGCQCRSKLLVLEKTLVKGRSTVIGYLHRKLGGHCFGQPAGSAD